MQLEGATELERRLYDLCRRFDAEGGCGELQTAIVVALSDASNELQRLRGFWPPGSNTWKANPNFRVFFRNEGEPACYCASGSLAEVKNAVMHMIEWELLELVADPGEPRKIQLEGKFMTDAEVEALPEL